MPDGQNHRVGARGPRGRRASGSVFEGVDLRETVEHLSIASYAVDRQGTIRWVNQGARVLVGDIVPPPR